MTNMDRIVRCALACALACGAGAVTGHAQSKPDAEIWPAAKRSATGAAWTGSTSSASRTSAGAAESGWEASRSRPAPRPARTAPKKAATPAPARDAWVALAWDAPALTAAPASTVAPASAPVVATPETPAAAPTAAKHEEPAPAAPAAAPARTESPAPAGPAVAQGTAAPAPGGKPEAPRPVPTGLERLSDEWPKWVKVGVQYRGRAEGTEGLAAVNGRDDGYYLNRIRLDATVVATPWLRTFVQVQDSQTLGFNTATQPLTMTNTFDLRQAYVDVQPRAASGLALRVGRQELGYGEQRLIGSLEWTNTARTFDAARATLYGPRGKVDVFAASVVRVEQDGFDRRRTDERLYGAAATVPVTRFKGVVEPYVFVRDSDLVAGELGARGEGRVYAPGARIAAVLPNRVDVVAEVVVERGTLAGQDLSAWAGHYALGWLVSRSPVKPRVFVEFNHASGDTDAADGRRQTFDQFYPTNHAKYGLVDQVGWRNMRDAVVGVDLSPAAKVKLTTTLHQAYLATTADGLYNAGGARTVFNPQATSRNVGAELGMAVSYVFSRELSLGAGFGYLIPGAFLEQSTTASPLWSPYVMWNVKF